MTNYPVTAATVRAAADTMRKYIDGKSFFDNKVIENERWWQLQHWGTVKGGAFGASEDGGREEPRSAWLFNSLANKHADAMDNYPEANVLPRAPDDKEDAEELSKIIPVILEQNSFEKTYSDQWWVKLKTGLPVFGVFWDPTKEHGMGDISVKGIDILRIYWQPGISELQESENVFYLDLVPNSRLLKTRLPYGGELKTSVPDVRHYIREEKTDDSDKSLVVDWYYKKNGLLHLCKFCGECVLFASENEPERYPRGYYEHGLYPFVLDPLFPQSGSIYAFSYLDIMKDPQMYIDRMNRLFLENAAVTSVQRYWAKRNSGVDIDDFCDLSKQIVSVESSDIDSVVRPIQTKALDGNNIALLQMKIDELKETSANRDFSQGGTSSGVTAAAAIAALQEAGNKQGRDVQAGSYRAFTEICHLIIENVRSFYDKSRTFRITGENGTYGFVSYPNERFREAAGLSRRPVFDIRVKPQRRNPYTKAINNETVKELFGMGFFDPKLADQSLVALGAMDFEGKGELERAVKENKTLYDTVMQLQAEMAKAAAVIGTLTGRKLGDGENEVPQTDAKAKASPKSSESYEMRIRNPNTSAEKE